MATTADMSTSAYLTSPPPAAPRPMPSTAGSSGSIPSPSPSPSCRSSQCRRACTAPATSPPQIKSARQGVRFEQIWPVSELTFSVDHAHQQSSDGSPTPLQAISELLPENNQLRNPIPARLRVPLDASPEAVLRQLDHEPPWKAVDLEYPVFPPEYPPLLRPVRDAQLLCTAFTASKNAILEWLGDTVIAVAVYTCLYGSRSDCSAPVNTVRIHVLYHLRGFLLCRSSLENLSARTS
ncbi:hypothetical protein B0H11DRAFT_2003322 [Mycena galericulata]|nr:hypothetical protein B0H11DRAFT_2003322 [Mycena galericulata]